MTAAELNFTAIEQGATFNEVLTLTDNDGAAIDLTGVTAKMQVRQSYSSPVLVELSTTNGRIVIDAETGQITLTIPASVTTELKARESVIYDLELTWASGRIDRLFEGTCPITAEVTR